MPGSIYVLLKRLKISVVMSVSLMLEPLMLEFDDMKMKGRISKHYISL
jgi:hypothetical protein